MTTEAITIYHSAVAALDAALGALHSELSSAVAARPVDRDTLVALIDPVARAGEDVRRAVDTLAAAANEPTPEWADRTELELAAASLGRRAEERMTNRWRERLGSVAEALSAGRVINRFTGRVSASLDELRSQAAAEVATAAQGVDVLDLPGPGADAWLAWVWNQPGEELAPVLEPVRSRLPALCAFLDDVDPKNWSAPTAPTAPEPPAPPAPEPPATLAAAENLAPPEPPALPRATAAPPPPQPNVPRRAPNGIGVAGLNKAIIMRRRPTAPVSARRAAGAIVKPTPPIRSEPSARSGGAASGAGAGPTLPEDREVAPEPPTRPVDEVDWSNSPHPESPPTPITPNEERGAEDRMPAPLPARERPPEAAPAPQRTEVPLASAAEIEAACRAKDFLRAALLMFGREAAGATGLDPTGQVALVAHHVLNGSAAAPWPDWCLDAASAREVVAERPVAAQFVYLAAQCQAATGADPLTAATAAVLIDAFRALAPVRQWLDVLHEVRGMPGLLERLRALTPTHDAMVEFRAHRAAFLEHANRASQLRDRAAYHHRQDQYLSRQPAGTKLLKFLQPTAPPNAARAPHPDIDEFLAQTPDAIVSDWLASMNGAIVVKGNQRNTLRKQAEEYVRLAARAWNAARAVVGQGVHTSEVERFRDRFAGHLPAARAVADKQLWAPLFERLTTGG